jgi:hypothetical protein
MVDFTVRKLGSIAYDFIDALGSPSANGLAELLCGALTDEERSFARKACSDDYPVWIYGDEREVSKENIALAEVFAAAAVRSSAEKKVEGCFRIEQIEETTPGDFRNANAPSMAILVSKLI